jgi:hypothetical protein
MKFLQNLMYSTYHHLLLKTLASVILVLFLGACRPAQPDENLPSPNFPAPTLNPLFYSAPTATPGENGYPPPLAPSQSSGGSSLPQNTPADPIALQSEPSPSPSPTTSPAPSPTATPSPTPMPDYRRVTVYNDAVDSNWTLRYSDQMRYNEKDPSAQHDGKYSLSLTPLAPDGSLLFSVRQTAKEPYPRSEAVGVSFWLYTGEQDVKSTDLSVSILGSNRFPFWFPDDKSVESNLESVFPETPLNFIDGSTTIPAKTWIQVVVLLDDLADNPDYENVTGIQIKNDASFLNTVYLDQVELLMQPAGK